MKQFLKPIRLIVKDHEIDAIYANKYLTATIPYDHAINQPVLLVSELDEKKTAIAKVLKNGMLKKIKASERMVLSDIRPKDYKQQIFIDQLLDPRILLNLALGPAGTGKSLLACSFALQDSDEHKRKIYLSKPTAFVGEGDNAFGPVPGDRDMKLAPYIEHYMMAFKKILGQKNSSGYLEMMIQKEIINFAPIEYIRGCSFDDAVVILDEVQNLTWHELKTVISRMGQNTKLILLGDPYQIDVPLKLEDTGLYKLVNSDTFRSSHISSGVFLTEQHRGPIARLAAEIDKELRKKRENTQHIRQY